jgi:protein ImuA
MLRADTQLLQAPPCADRQRVQAVPYADKQLLQAPPCADRQRGLEQVLRNPAIWRAEQVAQAAPGISTGYSALDQVLPDSGWTVGALTELLVSATGTGELSLLLPALRAVCTEGRGIALLAPPYLPQARAWEATGIPLERLLVIDSEPGNSEPANKGRDLLWAAEQILRSGECGAVVVWGQAAGRALNHRALQRLQLAASTGNALCFLYRSVAAQTSPSPAPLRLRLAAQAGSLHVHVVKCRGAVHAKPVPIQLFPTHWHTAGAQVPSAQTSAKAPSGSLQLAVVPLQPAASLQLCLV